MSVVEKAIHKLQEQKQRAAEGASVMAGQASLTHEHSPMHSATAGSAGQQPPIVLERSELRAAGLLPPEEDIALLSRQYRKIKHPLVARAVGRDAPRAPKGNLIMITSAIAGEGKSFTALNLALSLAMEKDVRVLLVDADVAKPQLSHVLGLGESPGLLDALRDGRLDVESLIRATDIPSLSFLAAGVRTEEATELLSSSRMAQIAELFGRHDSQRIVLLDSPPLLQTTESPALTHVVGQIVVVVRADSTPQPVLLDALKALEGHPEVSLVLNQSTRSVTSAYYYYGYEYGSERPTKDSA